MTGFDGLVAVIHLREFRRVGTETTLIHLKHLKASGVDPETTHLVRPRHRREQSRALRSHPRYFPPELQISNSRFVSSLESGGILALSEAFRVPSSMSLIISASVSSTAYPSPILENSFAILNLLSPVSSFNQSFLIYPLSYTKSLPKAGGCAGTGIYNPFPTSHGLNLSLLSSFTCSLIVSGY